MDLETDFSSDSDYAEFANETSFAGDILQLFLYEPTFTAAENIQAKKDLAGVRRKEMFYLTTHSKHLIYGYMVSHIW